MYVKQCAYPPYIISYSGESTEADTALGGITSFGDILNGHKDPT